jgi:hypothetical protein
MMVLDNIHNAIIFQQNFESWTSGNDDIDKFIQDTQLSAHSNYGILDALEWIPYSRFINIKYIEKLGIYNANWIDGSISYWDNYNRNWKGNGNQNWIRNDKNILVTLNILNDPKNIALEFMNEVLFNEF